MTDKELRRLRRDELLEILLVQQKEIDRLTAALEEAEQRVMEREIKIMNAGSIAEASLALTQVFTEAQRAADLYIENIKRRTGAADVAEPAAAEAASAVGGAEAELVDTVSEVEAELAAAEKADTVSEAEAELAAAEQADTVSEPEPAAQEDDEQKPQAEAAEEEADKQEGASI